MKHSIVSKKELERLIDAFSAEAAKFHNLRFSTFSVTQEGPGEPRQFDNPNHTVMLWQYYGPVRGEHQLQLLTENLVSSNLDLAGLRGAQLSLFALLEGDALQLFLRMAKRAGSLFNSTTADSIKSRVTKEIMDDVILSDSSILPMSVVNNNALAIWLNYLLYHLSLVNPGATRIRKIDTDPFSLSLLALERLEEEQKIGKIDRSRNSIDKLRFKIALSFPGERRSYVAVGAEKLRDSLGPDSIFYDHDYQSQLARPNLDLLLQDIYANRAELVVVFFGAEYQENRWCGLEWRSIRSFLTTRTDSKIMFVRFDDSKIDGVFPNDGYLDARKNRPGKLAQLIIERFFATPTSATGTSSESLC
jgi:hypothetical protein